MNRRKVVLRPARFSMAGIGRRKTKVFSNRGVHEAITDEVQEFLTFAAGRR
jgi:hypothetical protein